MKRKWTYLLIGLALANVLAFVMVYQRYQETAKVEQKETTEPSIIIEETETMEPVVEVSPVNGTTAKPIRPDELEGVHVIVASKRFEQAVWDSAGIYYKHKWKPEKDKVKGDMEALRTASYNQEIRELEEKWEKDKQKPVDPMYLGNSSKKMFYTYEISIDSPLIWKADPQTYYYMTTMIAKGYGTHISGKHRDEKEEHRFDIIEFKLEDGKWLVNQFDYATIDPTLFQNYGNWMQTR